LGGVAADHLPLPLPVGIVAPALVAKEHNTIKSSLVPFACWRAQDMRFEFGSSIVGPDMRAEVAELKKLIDRHTLPNPQGVPTFKPALSVFGHADPTGNDDFNKVLSGRRAQAIYAMLTRKVDLWDQLHANPQGQDKWEPKAIFTMQDALGRPRSSPLAAGARRALFKDYMDDLCTVRDAAGQPVLDAQGQPVQLQLQTTDFLGNGADPGGKADFQGCGEFNPFLIFSDSKSKIFADPDFKDLRDAENAPNRRVLIFLFRAGVRVDPSAWPCPRAKEGSEGCKKRFFSDGEDRRTRRLPDADRKFDQKKDTFACRFYQRLADKSPCEQTLLTYQLKLFDRDAVALPFAPFVVIHPAPRAPQAGRADKDAVLTANDLKVPDTIRVRWSLPKPGDNASSPNPNPAGAFDFQLDVFVDIPDEQNDRTVALQRLRNMSYTAGPTEQDDVADFQNDYRSRLPASTLQNNLGLLDQPTMDVLQDAYNSANPLVKAQT
jgi:hypothetical protein